MAKRSKLIICLYISAFIIFILSLIFSYLFIDYDYAAGRTAETEDYTESISYDKLTTGNTSGNLAQYTLSDSTYSKRENYGTACIKNGYVYFYSEKNNKSYVLKAPIDDLSNAVPILEGYTVSYINVIDDNLYFVGESPANAEGKRVYSMQTDGGSLRELASAEDDVISLIVNGSCIYYSVDSDPSTYVIDIETETASKWVSFPDGQIGIRFFGIDKSYVYYINNDGMGKIDLITKQRVKISSECVSIYQSPMLTDSGICYYSGLNNREFVYISKAGSNTVTILDTDTLKAILSDSGSASHINYSSGYLFFTIGGNIYYSSLADGTLQQLKGAVVSGDNRIFLNNEYCIYEVEDGFDSINVNWILSQ